MAEAMPAGVDCGLSPKALKPLAKAPLAKAAGINITETFGVRRRFGDDDADWRFVHSFEKANFLQQLLADIQADQLSMRPPYFSRDLSTLLAKNSTFAGTELKDSIMPDRATQRYVRTEWSPATGQLMQVGVRAGLTLLYQPMREKALEERREAGRGHGCAPSVAP